MWKCNLKTTDLFWSVVSLNLSFQDGDPHPVQTIAHLMKLSFDEGHRHAICQLGGINVIANLIEVRLFITICCFSWIIFVVQVEHARHGVSIDDAHCILLRRYACMTLTNLTFGDSGNKALLCSYREFMRALVVQLQSSSDELRQVHYWFCSTSVFAAFCKAIFSFLFEVLFAFNFIVLWFFLSFLCSIGWFEKCWGIIKLSNI